METRSDLNLKKVPVAKARNSTKEAGLRRKVVAASFERQAGAVSRKKEIPQLTPLHRLQRFKAIRDKNLKSKGFKVSLESKIKKMEEVETATTTTVEIKEKLTVKETFEEVKVSNTNGIENGDTKELENGHDENNDSPKEEHRRSSRLKEVKIDEVTVEKSGVMDQEESRSIAPEPIQDNNIESHMEAEEANKLYTDSLAESDAVSSISSQQAVTNSTPGPTDDEEEVEIVESKPEYELNLKEDKSDSIKQEENITVESSLSSKQSAEPSSKCSLNSSAASSYKTSYNNLSRIYGRRPVRSLAGNRKRKLDEDSAMNWDNKRSNSPSQPSPRWRFFPTSVNLWTPRKTPFLFPATTPIRNLNDSMTVNVDEDTIHSHMDDSDLFSGADELAPQPAKKSRWGCAVM